MNSGSIHVDVQLDLFILILNIEYLGMENLCEFWLIKISKEIAKTGVLYELFIGVLFDQLNAIRLEILY
jgi:hypothetical protein